MPLPVACACDASAVLCLRVTQCILNVLRNRQQCVDWLAAPLKHHTALQVLCDHITSALYYLFITFERSTCRGAWVGGACGQQAACRGYGQSQFYCCERETKNENVCRSAHAHHDLHLVKVMVGVRVESGAAKSVFDGRWMGELDCSVQAALPLAMAHAQARHRLVGRRETDERR